MFLKYYEPKILPVFFGFLTCDIASKPLPMSLARSEPVLAASAGDVLSNVPLVIISATFPIPPTIPLWLQFFLAF